MQGHMKFGTDNVVWDHFLRIEEYLGVRLEVGGNIDPPQNV